MSNKVVLGYWDCPFCNKKKIRGDEYSCPGCGRGRGKETRFYVDPNNIEYIDPISSEADWFCEHCDTLNSSNDNVCKKCAAPRYGSGKDYFSFNKDRKGKLFSAEDLQDQDTATNFPGKIEAPIRNEYKDDNNKEEIKDTPERAYSNNNTVVQPFSDENEVVSASDENKPVSSSDENEPENELENEPVSSSLFDNDNVSGVSFLDAPITNNNDANLTSNNDDKNVASNNDDNNVASTTRCSLRDSFARLDALRDIWGTICQFCYDYVHVFKFIGLVIAGVALVGLIVIGLIHLFTPQEVIGTIAETRWTSTVYIEELKTFNESDWDLPYNARLQYTRSEIRSYEKVLDHVETHTKTRQVLDGYETKTELEDMGNGTFKPHEVTDYSRPKYHTETYTEEEKIYRDEPVYDTKYYYEIDRWVITRSPSTTGTDKSPYWPEITLTDKERERNRYTAYNITFTYLNKKEQVQQKTISTDEDYWATAQAGDPVKLTFVAGFLKEWTILD